MYIYIYMNVYRCIEKRGSNLVTRRQCPLKIPIHTHTHTHAYTYRYIRYTGSHARLRRICPVARARSHAYTSLAYIYVHISLPMCTWKRKRERETSLATGVQEVERAHNGKALFSALLLLLQRRAPRARRGSFPTPQRRRV